MKGFKFENGDVVFEKGVIPMVEGDELLRQTVESVLGTNKGEWEFNTDEGIDFRAILKKRVNHDEIRNQILQGLQQVDETFMLQDYNWSMDGRKLNISFVAVNSEGRQISQSVTY